MTVPLSLSSVPAVLPYIQYVATGGQTVYPYPFPITQDADLVVVINGVTQPTDSGYTLSGQGNSTGGNVTLNSGSTGGDIITLFRNVTIQRLTQIGQNSGFSSAAFNAEFNNIYLILQQLQESISLSLQIPNTNSPSPTTNLASASYANKYMAFDAFGNPTPAMLTSSGSLTGGIIAGLLNSLTAQAPLIDRVRSGPEIAANVFPTNYSYPTAPHDVRRYGAVMNGSADDSAAWASLALVMGQGGSGYAPPLTTKITTGITIAAPSYQKISLLADGCTIQTTGSIKPIKVTGGFMGGLDIRGIMFDNTIDGLALCGVDLFGAQSCNVIDCWWRVPNAILPVANAALVVLEPSDPTNNNTAPFWNRVIRCGVRQSSGNATYYANYAVLMLGACNATQVLNCQFSSAINHIGIVAQTGGGATGTLANAVLVEGNAFEGGTNAVFVDGKDNTSVQSHIEGLRIIGNRTENLSGSLLSLNNLHQDSSVPTFLAGNYSVSNTANYVTQATGAVTVSVNSFDPSITPSWGVGSVNTTLYTNGFWFFKSASNADDAVKIGVGNTGSGIGLFTGATRIASWRYRAGGGAYIDSVNGWDARNLQGLSGSSTQAKNLRGTATFVAATTIAVVFGSAEADATYFVALGGNAAGFCWVTAKATTGFTINCSASNSNATDWVLIR